VTVLLNLLDKMFIIGIHFLTQKREKRTVTCKKEGYPGVWADFIFGVNNLCCNLTLHIDLVVNEATRVARVASQWKYMVWRYSTSTFSTSTQKSFYYYI